MCGGMCLAVRLPPHHRTQSGLESVDGGSKGGEATEERLEEVEAKHIGAVAFGIGRVGVSFDEEAIGADCDCGTGNGFNHVGTSTGDAAGGVWLLKRVSDVHNNGASALLLHFGNTAEVNDEVAVAKRCAAVGDHHLVVAALTDFVYGKSHGSGRKELSFFDVDGAAGSSSGLQEVGLTAKESGNLEYVDVFSGQFGFVSGMNVGHGRNTNSLAHFRKDFEGFFVANALKRV